MNVYKANKTLPLEPVTSQWMHDLFAQSDLMHQLLDKYDSPINILNITSFKTNIKAYKNLFKNYHIDGQIYFARKANKTATLINSALQENIGIDTASYNELNQAIERGGKGKSLVLTSAIKTPNQLKLALAHEVPVILDNQDEFNLYNKIASSAGKTAHIGVRISGFRVNGQKLYSRFGIDIDSIKDFINDNFINNEKFPNLRIYGLHFHLNGYSTIERSQALLQTIEIAKYLRANSFPIKFIDIGGGITMNYLKDETQLEAFKTELQSQVMHIEKEELTFRRNGLGYKNIDGKLSGTLETYPYFNKIHTETFIKKILDFQNNGETIAQSLNKNNLQLRIEPGRSLLQQVGITVARVNYRKKDSEGRNLIGLEMNMSQLKSASTDFLLDPYIIYRNPIKNNTEWKKVYFTGAYCLEQDIILKKVSEIPQIPEIGDIVVFVNTAGYLMHFYERQAHLFNLSNNLTLDTMETECLEISDFKLD
ncbi:Y4yA family PLP-dependent enzyme [Aequorivita xiaoshiensis]|uniref:Y4yA family PLP-dependent enzyme n=1 Tax=Aequorivita xiaoshiensis TaxID=2874476 RepID=A0A9X1QYM3_9FLAO|nr:Y4yA family PLP-dependent enzyme [Aequorivita xiaoshiensis]MCG2429535.1 Y4yA family PLP-dependent enzyme [Aequorivita xiaoshiensis]